MKKKLFVIIFFSVVFMGGCALQSDVIYIDDRVDAIEQKISKQNLTSGDTEKSLRAEYARLNNQLDTLNEMLSLIEGRFDEVDHALALQKENILVVQARSAKVDSKIESFSRQIQHLETYTGYEPSDASSAKEIRPLKNDSSQVAVAPGDRVHSEDVLLYEKAKAALDKNQLKAARELFAQLITKFPNSDKVDNAQFWIGESYYRSKWYQKAILEYQKVIENFPKGNKVAGAYLKQGLAFAKLGEDENARIVLNDLIKKFPNSGEALIARKKLDKVGKT